MAEELEASQYLTFTPKYMFAVDVARVREILEFTNITKVSQVPDFLLRH